MGKEASTGTLRMLCLSQAPHSTGSWPSASWPEIPQAARKPPAVTLPGTHRLLHKSTRTEAVSANQLFEMARA